MRDAMKRLTAVALFVVLTLLTQTGGAVLIVVADHSLFVLQGSRDAPRRAADGAVRRSHGDQRLRCATSMVLGGAFRCRVAPA